MNNVSLIGRIVKDVDLRFASNSGKAVAKFTLAINRVFKKDETDFINCLAFGKAAEIIAQYTQKGSQIGVTGSIRTGSYDAKDGSKRYTTDIIVENFQFLGNNARKSENDNGIGSPENYEELGEPIFGEDMPF